MYLGTRYDVYGFITLRYITICFFHVTFDLHLWPSAFVKVTCTLIIISNLCCKMFVVVCSLKFVGSVEFEIWTFVWRKPKWRHYDVITNLILLKFTYKSAKSISYVSGISNFSLIRYKRAKIYSREVNREKWRKIGYWVTLTFDLRSPNLIEFETVRKATE